MERVWQIVADLIRYKVRHRSGFRLGTDAAPGPILEQAQKELDELKAAPGDFYELGDLLAILIDYAQMRGWSLQLVQHAIMDKFLVRFDLPDELVELTWVSARERCQYDGYWRGNLMGRSVTVGLKEGCWHVYLQPGLAAEGANCTLPQDAQVPTPERAVVVALRQFMDHRFRCPLTSD